MEDIKKTLLHNDNVKLTKEEYQYVINIEKKRLLRELLLYSFMSFMVGWIMYFSLSPEIERSYLHDD